MNYQRPENITAYAKESADIICQMKKLHKNPRAGLKNNFMICVVFTIISSIYVIGVLAFFPNEPFLVLLSGMMLLLIALYIFRLISFKRSYKLIADNQEHREIELDQTGITSKYKDYSITYNRDGIKCIRVFRYSIVIIPNKPELSGLVLPIENLEQLEAGLKENNYNVEIIDDYKASVT